MILAKRHNGFTLPEMVASAAILGAAVFVISSLGARCITGVRLNREYELAWDILDRQLTLVEYIGISDFLELGRTDGSFGDENQPGRVYHWQAQTAPGRIENLYVVTMTVRWGQNGKSNQVSAYTLMTARLTEETQATQTQGAAQTQEAAQ